jgi:RPA family protein
MKRETAWRIFAGEFNDSNVEIKSEEEMAPSYVITPLGAKLNRVFIIGVLTDIENISESGDLVRAHISDPTGVFTLYSGQYQKDVTDVLSKIEVPAFVAVTGKVRTYSPEEGTLYVSIRPEKIMEVSSDIRDKWIVETCRNTKDRIEAIIEAMKMDESTVKALRKLGYSLELSEGIVEALKGYGNVDLNKYVAIIEESLQYLKPGNKKISKFKLDKKEKRIDPTEEIKKSEKTEVVEEKKITIKSEPTTESNTSDPKQELEKDFLDNENSVLDIIKQIEGEDGAAWDEITEKCEKSGLDRDTIEEAINSLMDKGLIYEPVLGTIKTT